MGERTKIEVADLTEAELNKTLLADLLSIGGVLTLLAGGALAVFVHELFLPLGLLVGVLATYVGLRLRQVYWTRIAFRLRRVRRETGGEEGDDAG